MTGTRKTPAKPGTSEKASLDLNKIVVDGPALPGPVEQLEGQDVFLEEGTYAKSESELRPILGFLVILIIALP